MITVCRLDDYCFRHELSQEAANSIEFLRPHTPVAHCLEVMSTSLPCSTRGLSSQFDSEEIFSEAVKFERTRRAIVTG